MSEPFDENNKGENLNNTGIYDFDDKYKETKYNDDIAGILKTANRESERSRALAAQRRKARKKRIITPPFHCHCGFSACADTCHHRYCRRGAGQSPVCLAAAKGTSRTLPSLFPARTLPPRATTMTRPLTLSNPTARNMKKRKNSRLRF